MYPESISEVTVKEIWRRAMRNAETIRKDDASRKLDFYNDCQGEHILEAIRQQYKMPERLLPVGLNVVRKIIRALSMVYLSDATRIVDGSEQDKAIYAEIEDSAVLPVKLKQANRYAKLLGTLLLRPVWRNGKMNIDLLTPDILDVVTGDSPEDLRAVMVTLYDESGDTGEVQYSLWTAEEYRLLNHNGLLLHSEPNPYGLLPFVPIWDSPATESFWQPGANNLMLIQDAINQRLTDLWYTLQFQGFGVGYVRGKDVYVDNLTLGPGTLVTLPPDGEIGFASPSAPVEASLAALDFLVKYAAITNGLPAATMSPDPSEESGVAKIVGNRELEELRRDDIAAFARVEEHLFQVFRVVWNVHNPGRQMGEAATLTVDFYDPKPSTSGTDQLKEWEGLLALGLASPVDILIEKNPDLTRDAAKARLLEIHDEIREFGTQQFSPAYPA